MTSQTNRSVTPVCGCNRRSFHFRFSRSFTSRQADRSDRERRKNEADDEVFLCIPFFVDKSFFFFVFLIKKRIILFVEFTRRCMAPVDQTTTVVGCQRRYCRVMFPLAELSFAPDDNALHPPLFHAVSSTSDRISPLKKQIKF